MIPEHQVAEVRARADIVEIVGEHVPLKRAGKDFRGLCPFHQEKTPSFYVVPAKGIFNCFGCSESGDVFTFLMKRQGLSFQEAVRQVAQRVGVEITETSREQGREEEHKRLYEALAFAADFYRRQLVEEPAGEIGRRYLRERGVSDEASERFGLGYAPDEWQALRSAALRQGFLDDELLACGVVKQGERAPEPYDRLRGRLVFPITDLGGRVIGFGGRLVGPPRDNSPKYLNSPETPVYHKGRVLYGLSWSKAAIRREQAALVVEGYMDYVSLAAAGIENVVAPLGTALTDEQAKLLARYTKKAVLLYDSDKAGLRATFRSGDELLRAGVHPLVATLPPGEDPDSLVRKGGAAAVRRLLDQAVDVLDRKLQILEERGFLDSIEGVRKAVDGLLPTLRAATDPTLRDIYVARVAERTGVRRETLELERGRLAEAPVGAATAGFRPGRSALSGRGGPPFRRTSREPTERMLLLLLVRDHERIPAVAAALSPDDFRDPIHRELFTALTQPAAVAEVGSREPPAAADEDAIPWLDPAVVEGLGPAARELLGALRRDPVELNDGDRILAEAVGDIRARALFRQLDELDVRMATAAGEEQGALLKARADVQRALREIGTELGRLGFKVSPRYRRRYGVPGVDRT